MAVDEKISQLPEALTLDGEDVVPIVQVSTGLNKKVKVSTLLQDAGFIKDIVSKYDVDTVLEIGKINWINSTADHTMSVPIADSSYLGEILIVNNRSIYSLTITGAVVSPWVVTGVNSIVGLVCVTNGYSYGWEVFSMYNTGDFDLISQTITNGVTNKAPSEDAVFDALALKEDLITKNALSTPLVWTSANGVASFQPLPVLGDLTYYLTNTASDVATYYKQTTTPQVALTSLPFASVTNGQLLATFISEPNNPNRLSIPDGQYLNHLHLGKTGGTKDLQVRAEMWETTSAGVDIVKLADLGPSTILVGSGSTEYIIGYNTVEKTLSAVTSRIATKVYAVVSGGGSAPSISIFQGDGSDSRSNLPAPVVDATNYVPYEGMLKDLTTGSKDIIYSNATVSTPTFFDSAKKFISATAQLWGTWVQTWSNKATPVDADTVGFHDSATTFVGVKSTLLNLWTAYFKVKADALYVKSGTLTNLYVPYFNGTALTNSLLKFYGAGSGFGFEEASTNSVITLQSTNTNNAIRFYRGSTPTLDGYMNNTSSSLTLLHTTGIDLTFGVGGAGGISGNATQILHFANNNHHFFVNGNSVGFFSNSYFYSNRQLYVNSGGVNVVSGGIYTGASSINASAILQADSTTKGFLPPRMTNAQRTAIASPAIGLMVYCTDATEGLYIYKSTGWTFII